jgi:hypothetical protein
MDGECRRLIKIARLHAKDLQGELPRSLLNVYVAYHFAQLFLTPAAFPCTWIPSIPSSRQTSK